MSNPNIVRKRHRHVELMHQLATLTLLGLILWLGLATSASAQSIPPTSPCPPGGVIVPPGWVASSFSPDCSTVSEWHSGGPLFPWTSGNVPPTPGGHTTFVSIGSNSSAGVVEGLATTITGLQAGRTYSVSIFFNASITSVQNVSCPGIVTINGVVTPYPAAPSLAWTQRLFPFVATGPTATFDIRTGQVPGLNCLSNIYVENVVLEPGEIDVQVIKTVSPTGPVASGSVLTYTLTASNNGSAAATNVALGDQPSAGLNCATPSTTATCSASGGASCPGATVPVSTLIGPGIRIPTLPVSGQVVVTLRCTVTATGR